MEPKAKTAKMMLSFIGTDMQLLENSRIESNMPSLLS